MRLRPGLRVALLVAALLNVAARAAAPSDGAIAIVVNPENHVPDPSVEELREMFLLDKQFWPDGRRIALFLPAPGATGRAVLLDRVYGMSDFDLRKEWVGKLFRGAIPSIPSTFPSVAALLAAVVESPGGMSAVPASSVTPAVRVLRVGGKAPADPGYPLVPGR